MVIVHYFIKNKIGHWVAGENRFSDAFKAVRFIKMMKRQGARAFDWCCYDPEDDRVLMEACALA